MLNAFHFRHPDKIPVVYPPSPAGLYMHGQKLLDLFNQYPPDNPIIFDSVPVPDPDTIDADGRYHEFRKDAWGTEWEYLIFGITGHPKGYPFAGWEAARDFEFPPVAALDSSTFAEEKKKVETQKKEYLVFAGGISLFERLHGLRPMDEVLVSLGTGDRHFMEFLDRLTAYWRAVIDYHLALGADVILFGDDWGTQTAPIVSPELFREVFKPRYQALMGPIKQAGRKVFLHCCGLVGELFDDFLDLGIDGYWPQITCYDPDVFVHKCREHQVAIYIHPDRQRLVPLGTPREIETAIHAYAERYRGLGGGGIFYIEMENDAPFENVKTLIQAVHRYR